MLVGLLETLWFDASLVLRVASTCSFFVSLCSSRTASGVPGASRPVLVPVPVLTAREAAESPARAGIRLTTEGALVSGTEDTYKKQVKKKTKQTYLCETSYSIFNSFFFFF